MPERYVPETFFRPPEVGREHWSIPAAIFNPIQRLLARSPSGCVFVPIRAMQFQAIADREEIVFVDSQGGYASQDGVGGRLIAVAWQPASGYDRAALHEPVPCQVVHYRRSDRELQWRLVSELSGALAALEQRQREGVTPSPVGARIVTLRPRG